MAILKNKSYKEYSYTSRYSPFPYYYNTVDEKYMYGLSCCLDKHTRYTSHVISKGDTLDSLSLKFYNTPTLFWIIADFNDIVDPYQELLEGKLVKIPSISNIKFKFEGRS